MNNLHSPSNAKQSDIVHPEDLGYPPNIVVHLSNEEASYILHTQHGRQVQLFINALHMQRPVSHDVASSFLEFLFKDTIPADTPQLTAHMRASLWEQYLTPPEILDEIAHRAAIFFDSEAGVELSNFYTKIIARTTY